MDCQGRGTKIRFIHYRETLYPVIAQQTCELFRSYCFCEFNRTLKISHGFCRT
jgi:hypothetical protein